MFRLNIKEPPHEGITQNLCFTDHRFSRYLRHRLWRRTTQLEPEDPEVVGETVVIDEDKAPIATDGKPITVTDATFEDVVLNAEMPVVVELRAEW